MASSSTPSVAPTTWVSDINTKGEFVRKATTFRNWITKDGPFTPDANRYHLYVSYACPWAHRTLTVRKLKGLDHVISYSTVHWLLEEGGWKFAEEWKDPLHPEHTQLRNVYHLADPSYTGRITVPVLWDKKTNQIVNNESAEVIRMLNSEFNALAKNPGLDLYPEPLRAKIDEVNDWVYNQINNGVYKCGFARSQEAYDEAFDKLFDALDKVEAILAKSRYLTGSSLTEADVRLWTTLVRFDPVYVVHFKTNMKFIRDYPNIYGFLRDLYQTGDVKETVNMFHIKNHYYQSHTSINPLKIVPKGPALDYDTPHGRDKTY